LPSIPDRTVDGLIGKTSPCRIEDQISANSVAVSTVGGREARKAPLSAPTEEPMTKSGVNIPTWVAPWPAPPESTKATGPGDIGTSILPACWARRSARKPRPRPDYSHQAGETIRTSRRDEPRQSPGSLYTGIERGQSMRYQAVWRGTVLAESDDIVDLEGTLYFPPQSLHTKYFQTSGTTSSCPWKGVAYYFSIVVAGQHHPDSAWTYLSPEPAAEKIRYRVAFQRGIEIRHVDPTHCGAPAPQ
jgi:uncharacterized protein (DUF427 family)